MFVTIFHTILFHQLQSMGNQWWKKYQKKNPNSVATFVLPRASFNAMVNFHSFSFLFFAVVPSSILNHYIQWMAKKRSDLCLMRFVPFLVHMSWSGVKHLSLSLSRPSRLVLHVINNLLSFFFFFFLAKLIIMGVCVLIVCPPALFLCVWSCVHSFDGCNE